LICAKEFWAKHIKMPIQKRIDLIFMSEKMFSLPQEGVFRVVRKAPLRQGTFYF
jgi:hypothetical protein